MSDLSQLMKAPGAGLEADDDFERINALYMEKGWGDGLPIVPPTAARVEKMLAYCDRPLDQPLGLVAPRYGEATPLRRCRQRGDGRLQARVFSAGHAGHRSVGATSGSISTA